MVSHYRHSVIIPVFNERRGLSDLESRLKATLTQLGEPCEVILIDDGSRDGSAELLDAIAQQDPRFKVVHFSRNFGHQAAISAGLKWANGDTVTIMDADLQDPPELLIELIAKWKEGYEVVYATRIARKGENALKTWTASLFYRLIRSITQVDIPLDTGDFRLMDRKVVEALLRLPERNPFLRGLVSWVGYRQTGIPYQRAPRAHGTTHFTYPKMLKFAWDGITSFSLFPLRIAAFVGALSAGMAILGAGYTIYLKLFTDRTVPGWSSLLVAVAMLGGIQLVTLGIFGEYLGRIFDEVKQRPIYLIDRAVGFEKTDEFPIDRPTPRRKFG